MIPQPRRATVACKQMMNKDDVPLFDHYVERAERIGDIVAQVPPDDPVGTAMDRAARVLEQAGLTIDDLLGALTNGRIRTDEEDARLPDMPTPWFGRLESIQPSRALRFDDLSAVCLVRQVSKRLHSYRAARNLYDQIARLYTISAQSRSPLSVRQIIPVVTRHVTANQVNV